MGGKPGRDSMGRRIGMIGDGMLYSNGIFGNGAGSAPNAYEQKPTEFRFAYGPSAGGLLESVAFKMTTTGEMVSDIATDPYLKTRKLQVIGRPVPEALLVIERLNGPFSASHSIAFIGAVEAALGLEPDRHVQAARAIELELERIRNHLHVAARMCEAAAFGVPSNTLFHLRERINRVIGASTGHRFFYGTNNLCSVNAVFSDISAELEPIGREVADTYESLQESKIFIDRLQGNGKVSDNASVGPVARAAGFRYDAREDSNTVPYYGLGFSPVVEEGSGDALYRYIVRFEEMLQSFKIIRAAERRLSRAKSNAIDRLGSGNGIGRVESPSGDLAYSVSLRNGKVSRISMLNPSLINLGVFEKSAQGNVFTDFHFNWESFGIWISEIAVEFV